MSDLPHIAALNAPSYLAKERCWTIVALCGRKGAITVRQPTPMFGDDIDLCPWCLMLIDQHVEAGAREVRVSVWSPPRHQERRVWFHGGRGIAYEHTPGATLDRRRELHTLPVRDNKLIRRSRRLAELRAA